LPLYANAFYNFIESSTLGSTFKYGYNAEVTSLSSVPNCCSSLLLPCIVIMLC